MRTVIFNDEQFAEIKDMLGLLVEQLQATTTFYATIEDESGVYTNNRLLDKAGALAAHISHAPIHIPAIVEVQQGVATALRDDVIILDYDVQETATLKEAWWAMPWREVGIESREHLAARLNHLTPADALRLWKELDK